MRYMLRMTGDQHESLRGHLFAGDGRESVALLLCGRHSGDGMQYFLVHEIALVSFTDCVEREHASLRWRTTILPPLLTKAMKHHWAVVKIHSHPNGLAAFSPVDDAADADLFASVAGWLDDGLAHASAIMLPDTSIIARAVEGPNQYSRVDTVAVVGDTIRMWRTPGSAPAAPAHTESHAQLFGTCTTEELGRLKIGVVGVSGTGSIVVELLARLGVRTLVLVDPDRIEKRNLNRILHARMADVGRFKTDVAKDSVEAMGLGVAAHSFPVTLATRSAVSALASCDVVFGCMDGAEGRHLLNKVAAYYILPYVDVGIKLEADGVGGVSQICGSTHYLKPGGSSLLSRGAITVEQVEAESLRRTDPEKYAEHVRDKYIKGVVVNQPAVISLNAFYASMAVNECLARLHSYRDDGNTGFAWTCISLTQHYLYPPQPDGAPCPMLQAHVGRGHVEPLLGMPALS